MSFDLAGLWQRNTQNTLSGLSSSASVGRADMSGKVAEGTQTGSLTVGSAISGQVMKVDGDTVYVKLPSEVLTAKLQEGVNLQPGQSVTFAVSGISDKQITLQALFQNSAQTAREGFGTGRNCPDGGLAFHGRCHDAGGHVRR